MTSSPRLRLRVRVTLREPRPQPRKKRKMAMKVTRKLKGRDELGVRPEPGSLLGLFGEVDEGESECEVGVTPDPKAILGLRRRG